MKVLSDYPELLDFLTKPIDDSCYMRSTLNPNGMKELHRQKIDLIFLAYQIIYARSGKLITHETTNYNHWKALCFALLEDFIMGFKFKSDLAAAGHQRGRKTGSGIRIIKEGLVETINEIRKSKNNCSISEACKDLTRKKGAWKGEKIRSVSNRYHEIVKAKKIIDSLYEATNRFELLDKELTGLSALGKLHNNSQT